MNYTDPNTAAVPAPRRRPFLRKLLAATLLALVVLAAIAFVGARIWMGRVMRASLPQLDGTLNIPDLLGPVTIQRDTHGVPHITAATLDDAIIAQGFVTAQDRLWQMELLRRHASGSLAEVLGNSMLGHDRTQRTLLLRATAEHAIATLPPDQMHWLDLYARGVNASIALQRDHLPLEFRLLRYQPANWTPRDSILVGLSLFQDLTNSFSTKLSREAITAKLPPQLVADLYPTGSWRDHPPGQLQVDLTAPQTDIPNIPLDESQTKLKRPTLEPNTPQNKPVSTSIKPVLRNKPVSLSEVAHSLSEVAHSPTMRCAVEGPATRSTPHNPPCLPATESSLNTTDLLTLRQSLSPFGRTCDTCTPGSNNWVVAGTHTASGKPLLSNDMHLAHSVPGIWYQADLHAPTMTGDFHVAGVSLPGLPFILVGHNDHVAWGFTNLEADVQDLYLEHVRGTGPTAEFQLPNGTWRRLLYDKEVIKVHNAPDVILFVPATIHGNVATPLISSLLPGEKRAISLRWTLFDPANLTPTFHDFNAAPDAASLVAAFAPFGGPALNLVYADDQGHIGYHAIGKIPLRGNLLQPSPLSPIPTDSLDLSHEWSVYIPYDQLPQALDPPNGILATANARITPAGYTLPITLNWASPYRNERIWKVLAAQDKLTPADMLALQTDVYSDVDHVVAQRLAYAIDHSTTRDKNLRLAADLLRNWDGKLTVDSPAAAIVDSARAAFWPLILNPLLNPPNTPAANLQQGNAWELYTWSSRDFAQEQLIVHQPARWLPKKYPNWNEFLTDTVNVGLAANHAPLDLNKWSFGAAHPIDIEHPLFSRIPILKSLIPLPTGTGIQPQSGDTTTVLQTGRAFGPSERFTTDLSNLDNSTLNLVLGQSGNPASPWFMDQWNAWYHGTTFSMPWTTTAINATTTHTLTLTLKPSK